MARLSRAVRTTVKQGNLFPATILDVAAGKATVQLSNNGAIYRMLNVTGGPVYRGQPVHVDFTTSIPSVVAPSPEIPDVIVSRSRVKTPPIKPAQYVDGIIRVEPNGVRTGYPVTEAGLTQAFAECYDYCMVLIPECTLQNETTYSVPQRTKVVGISSYTSIIYGTFHSGSARGSEMDKLAIYDHHDTSGSNAGYGTWANCLIGPNSGKLTINDCIFECWNCGSGGATAIVSGTGEMLITKSQIWGESTYGSTSGSGFGVDGTGGGRVTIHDSIVYGSTADYVNDSNIYVYSTVHADPKLACEAPIVPVGFIGNTFWGAPQESRYYMPTGLKDLTSFTKLQYNEDAFTYAYPPVSSGSYIYNIVLKTPHDFGYKVIRAERRLWGQSAKEKDILLVSEPEGEFGLNEHQNLVLVNEDLGFFSADNNNDGTIHVWRIDFAAGTSSEIDSWDHISGVDEYSYNLIVGSTSGSTALDRVALLTVSNYDATPDEALHVGARVYDTSGTLVAQPYVVLEHNSIKIDYIADGGSNITVDIYHNQTVLWALGGLSDTELPEINFFAIMTLDLSTNDASVYFHTVTSDEVTPEIYEVAIDEDGPVFYLSLRSINEENDYGIYSFNVETHAVALEKSYPSTEYSVQPHLIRSSAAPLVVTCPDAPTDTYYVFAASNLNSSLKAFTLTQPYQISRQYDEADSRVWAYMPTSMHGYSTTGAEDRTLAVDVTTTVNCAISIFENRLVLRTDSGRYQIYPSGS